MNLRNARALLAVTWPFLGVVVVLAALAALSLDTLSAARAFVGGESLWTKGQKQSARCLERYARSGDPADFACHEQGLAVPQGDMLGRLALEQPVPDLALARRGFEQGGNHPDDVAGMIRLLQRFRGWGPVAEAVDIWTRADRHVLEILQLGERIRGHVEAGEREAALALLPRLDALDGALTPLERRFSDRLGAASRAAGTLLFAVTAAAALGLTALGMAMTGRMVARGRRTSAALKTSEQRLQLAIAASDHGIFDLDVRRRRLHVSAHFLAGLGHEAWPEACPLDDFLGLVHADDRATLMTPIEGRCADDRSDIEFRLRDRDGRWHWARAQGTVMRDGRGRVLRLAGALSDVSGRHDAEARLSALQDRARVTLASIGDAVVATDADGVVEYLNPVAERLLGLDLAAVQGRPAAEVCRFVDETAGRPLAHPVHGALRTRGPVRLDAGALLRRADGGVVPIDASASPIDGEPASGLPAAAGPLGAVLVLRDVSRERANAARLSYQATHDPVTGLINRREFERRLSQAIVGARERDERHALLYLDLDQFKIVNDTCGHAAGDELLRQVGALLKQKLRSADTLGRLGGDEFGVLLGHCDPAPAARLAEALRQTLADFRFACSGRSFPIGASIGMVHLDTTSIDLAGALSAADSACYVAKENGRNRVHAYHVSDDEMVARQGMMDWVARVQAALDEGRMRLHAQPIVPADPARREPPHLELLLRMVDRDGRLVPPMAFIPAAERYNLMPTVDRWVVRTAFEAIAADPSPALYAINLSGASICDERFLDFVRAEHRRCGVAPSQVCFEITETAVMSHLGRASVFIGALRELGFRFSLDDFGAGMSSFGYLKHLPVDFLKIDGSFVKDMLTDPIDAAMVETIHRIGRVMGMRTIAEFVDGDDVRERLRAIGVDFVQGFGIGRPQPFRLAAEAGAATVKEALAADTG